jgi:hypothetical protein
MLNILRKLIFQNLLNLMKNNSLLKIDSLSNKLFKFALIFLLLLVAFGFFSASEYEVYDLYEEQYISWWLDHYRELQCEYTLFDVKNSLNVDINFTIRPEPSGSVECFGKNFWVDYFPEKRIEDGWSENSPKRFNLRVATNLHLDLILQSIFWLSAIALIPKTNKHKFISSKLSIPLSLLLLYIHLVGERSYYSSIGRDFNYNFFYYDYDQKLKFDNFYLYSYFLIFFVIYYFLLKLISLRAENFINYSPFVFLISAAYSSLNLNFFVLVLSFLGINYQFKYKKDSLKFLLIYLTFALVWIYKLNSKYLSIDVDKIKGFSNTSQSYTSIIFWVITYYLVVLGAFYLFREFKKNINFNLLSINFLISSSLIVVFGYLSTIDKSINFLTYYLLGLNKTGIDTMLSVKGNTWRGLAPSAEGIGEFYTFSILFYIFCVFTSKSQFKYFHILFIGITLYGIFRANNAAAIISMLVVLFIFFTNRYISNKNLRKIIFLSFIVSGIVIFSYSIRSYSFQFLSNIMLFEAVNESLVDYDFKLNQYNQSAVDEANYGLLLNLPDSKTNFSSSLKYSLESYTYGNKIDNLPSIISSISAVSYFINRSEKWGVFLAKYNPSILDFLFGYGPNQFTQYFTNHETSSMNGLLLPHSSLLSYILFIGVFGVLLCICFLCVIIYKNRNFSSLLLIFVLINSLKSDSLLYIQNLYLFLLLINFVKYENSE